MKQTGNQKQRTPRRTGLTTVLTALAVAGAAFFRPPSLEADIYMYRDPDGVFHFTNVPTSPKYKVYVREWVKAPRKGLSASRFDDLIVRASRRHGLPFSILKAIIRAESGFDPKAVSRKGAMGLMQIMPENVKLLKVEDPFDPWDNIMAGARYFREMLDRYRGRLPLALAAYNAGPGAVDQYRAIPPYPETQQYVRRVLAFHKAYQ